MIGMIVAGYGRSATGLMSGIQLVAGKPERLIAVDYLQEDTTDDLELKLKQAIEDLKPNSDGILILTDLKEDMLADVCVELARKLNSQPKIRIVSGMNLGGIVEVNLARGYVSDLDSLTELAIENMRSQVSEMKPSAE